MLLYYTRKQISDRPDICLGQKTQKRGRIGMYLKPHGILPAMITPLDENGKVNLPVLRKLIDHLIAGGVHGIFAIGTTGEFYALSNTDYREILEVTVDEVAGRVPVYAGANAITTKDSIELC